MTQQEKTDKHRIGKILFRALIVIQLNLFIRDKEENTFTEPDSLYTAKESLRSDSIDTNQIWKEW